MAIGTGFGNGRAKWTVDETSNQNTRAPHGQSSISTTSSMTFQALAPATHDQVLTLYHTIPVRRAAPPRFALETSMLLGDFIAFKMDDIQDGVSVASEYKKSVYKLFFGDDYVTPVEKTVSALLSGYFPFSSRIGSEALNFANKFMAEAAVYGIDGHVFCRAACDVKSTDTFGKFISRCMDMQFGPPTQAPLVSCCHRIRANAEFILLKAESENLKHILLRSDRHLFVGLTEIFYDSQNHKGAHEIKATASSCLMVQVGLHHLGQLRRSADLNDLELAARLVNCLHLCVAILPKEHMLVEDIELKLHEHVERAMDLPVLDQCARAAASLKELSPEAAQRLVNRIAEAAEAVAVAESMDHFDYVLDWFRDVAKLQTVGGVGDQATFGFVPIPGENAAFDIARHGAKALELAETWLHDPFADMKRGMAILDHIRERSHGASPELMDGLREGYEAVKAGLAASPVPEVRGRAKLL